MLPRVSARSRARSPLLGDDGLAPVAGRFPGTNCRDVSREERERVINPFALEGANIVRVARDLAGASQLHAENFGKRWATRED
jgi:transposase-like protein